MMLFRLFILLWALLIALQFSACSRLPVAHSTPNYGFRQVRAEFSLGDASRFQFKITGQCSDGLSRLLVQYEKHEMVGRKMLGVFFKISTDGGASFGPERTLPESPARQDTFTWKNIAFIKGGLAVVWASRGSRVNLFYARSDAEGASWSEPSQLNDEQDSANHFGGFIHSSEDVVHCLWEDWRRGFPMIFSSASHDGGRTWSPNKPVEYDFREGEQVTPRLVAGASGRLLAFWADSRDRQTLKDIRCSYSDDGGRHWSPSQKINDDNEHVWQEQPRVVARGDHIYVAFDDFREPGEQGDNDWNVYFTSSQDNGVTWSKNIRVNDVQEGVDINAVLNVDERGDLYCVWRSGRESILGQVYFTHSSDGGKSWSRAIKVDDGVEMLLRSPYGELVLLGENLLCSWKEDDEVFSAWLEPLREPAPAGAPTPEPQRPTLIPFDEGDELFVDDFSDAGAPRWRPATGVWMVTDGAYMGVEPGAKHVFFSSFAGLKEPESYVMRGRFKLDPVDHRMANLYFRADRAGSKYYVIGHGFRTGVCLSLKEVDLPHTVFMGFVIEGRALAQRRFPFQHNRWYEFRLVVTPEQIDYYVDGRSMLTYKGPLKLPPGSIGLGGVGSAPTYFDDIAVHELRDEKQKATQ